MKILVIIPTYNRIEFLDEAFQSVESQTRPPDEVIVVGNVTPSKKEGYTYIHSEKDVSVKINQAVSSSNCDAFLVLCDDDTILSEYIEKTAQKMEEANADIVYTEYNNEPVTSLIRRSIWEKVGGFCTIPFFDWDFYWSCREAGALSLPIREHLFEYRRHPAQEAKHGEYKASGLWEKWTEEVMAKHPKKGRP